MDIRYPNLNRRVKAVVVDSLIFAILLTTFVPFIVQTGISPKWLKIILILLPFFIVEPFLVSVAGGSVGHHLMKIRIRKSSAEKNLDIFSAIIRFMVKTLFGFLSLFFILLTRRHQAFHDKIVSSIVVFKNPETVAPSEALKERVYEEEGYIYPSKWYRFLIFAAYAFIGVYCTAILGSFFLSEKCIAKNACNPMENVVQVLLLCLWLIIITYFFTKSMRAEIFGCRKKPEKTVTDSEH